MNIEIFEATPSAKEYVDLRKRSGLSGKSIAAAEIGLPNSLYSICIRDSGTLVGMGRVIGDGACFFEIVDVAVDPEYQGQGFGKRIMLKIDSYVERAAMGGSYVSMIADEPAFYEKFGYRRTAPDSHGMYKKFGVAKTQLRD